MNIIFTDFFHGRVTCTAPKFRLAIVATCTLGNNQSSHMGIVSHEKCKDNQQRFENTSESFQPTVYLCVVLVLLVTSKANLNEPFVLQSMLLGLPCSMHVPCSISFLAFRIVFTLSPVAYNT